jgi:hypothetical protein
VPYTPPAGNAVTFNFSGTYVVPPGNAVIFNFGGGSPAPPQAQSPTGIRQARLHEEDWFFSRQSRFAPIPDAFIALRHRGLARMPLLEPEPWIRPRRLEIRFQPPARRRRPFLFTIT